jgi:F-type H+-transporting ATPase subunit delta
MKNFEAAPQYAQALLHLAQARKNTSQVLDELMQVEALLKDNAKLGHLLCLPSLETEKKHTIIDQLFEKHFQPLTIHFLKHVILKNKIEHLAEILFYYKESLRESGKTVEAKVTSARPLNKETVAQLIKKLELSTQLKIELQTQVDASLIGGAIIQIKNQRMDFSVKRKLQELKEALIC